MTGGPSQNPSFKDFVKEANDYLPDVGKELQMFPDFQTLGENKRENVKL
jgi:hypothetical protein